MPLFSIEQSRFTYFADFVIYCVCVAALAAFLGIAAPHALHWELAAWALGGLAYWTLIEYGVHRFVLHQVPPFRAMHELHHLHPRDYIGTPTFVTLPLFAALAFLPAWWLTNIWIASALTLGVLLGYLIYSVTHHAAHHWRSSSYWMKRRKQLHGLHHQFGHTRHFGVTTSLWDHVFRSAHYPPRTARASDAFAKSSS